MKIDVRGVPEFVFIMTPELLKVLLMLSDAHYDSVCRAASRPCTVGFLNGWRNMMDGEAAPVSAGWRTADTVLKICEGYHRLLNAEETKLVCDFVVSLRAAMENTRAIAGSWQANAHE